MWYRLPLPNKVFYPAHSCKRVWATTCQQQSLWVCVVPLHALPTADTPHPVVATIRRALARMVDRVRQLETVAEEGTRASGQLDAATRTITNLQDLTGCVNTRVHISMAVSMLL